MWLTAGAGWVLAGQLRTGEAVRLLDGGTVTVVATRVVPGAAAMWDLTVSNVHTFAVGGGRYVVHNCGRGGTPDPDKAVPGHDNLYEGQQREDLKQQGWTRTKNDVADVKSDDFKEFVQNQNNGSSFDSDRWKYHMERWERGGSEVDNHYWQGTFDDDPYTDRYFHHH